MEKIGVGIIGLGMGQSMFGIKQIPDTALEILGICDTDADRLESIRSEHNVLFATTDYRELLQRDEIDVVGIYTPDPLHAQTASMPSIAASTASMPSIAASM